MRLAVALLVMPSIAFAADAPKLATAPVADVRQTGNPLDLALVGVGYFAIETANGPRYTRDGKFQIDDAHHRLVTSGGMAVRGERGKPIVIPVNANHVDVATDGTINAVVAAGRTTVGKLELVRLSAVTRDGALFAATGNPEAGELPTVRSGWLEVAPSIAEPTPTPVPVVTSQPTTDPKIELAPEPSSNGSLYAMFGVAALGLGAWYMRRRRVTQGPAVSIDVIAERSLGGRAKVVWFAAGGREMMVAITPQQICVLGQWRKQDSRAQLPEAHALPEPKLARPEKPMSAAVAGLLRLRQRADAKANTYANPNAHAFRNPFGHNRSLDEINEEVATGDLSSDALWAKEILEATGGDSR